MATTVHRFLAEHRHESDAIGVHHDDPSRLTWVMVTPRFRASSHVVFLLVSRDSGCLKLVAKVARLPGEAPSLDREARNLRMLAASRTETHRSVPRVVAYGSRGDSRVLLESPVDGAVMGSSRVLHRPDWCVRQVVRWLIALHRSTLEPNVVPGEAYDTLVRRPLQSFTELAPVIARQQELVDRTMALTQPLEHVALPWVFAHGDLSAPNILMTESGDVGVVDWELAEPKGLVCEDLFFFLTYVACTRRRAKTREERADAFDDAFVGPNRWTRPVIHQYARSLGLEPGLLPLLLVAGLARYVARLPERLGHHDGEGTLAESRFIDLWRHALLRGERRRLTGMEQA